MAFNMDKHKLFSGLCLYIIIILNFKKWMPKFQHFDDGTKTNKQEVMNIDKVYLKTG